MASLILHVCLLAGVVAVVGRPRESADGPVIVDTRPKGHEIGVVFLDRPAAQPVPQTIVVPVTRGPPPTIPVFVPPPPPTTVRQVGHQETRPIEASPPVTGAPGATGPVTTDSAAPAAVNNVPDPPPLPAGTATAFFGVPAIGKSAVYVLDRSASMGLEGRLERARGELAASLRRLPPSARFQVIAYNKSAEPTRIRGMDGLLPATPDAIQGVIEAVNRLPAEGGSEHLNALTKALALRPDVIYFLTDEDDLALRDVQAVARLNYGRACIHALCLVPPTGESPMLTLARENRGQFAVVGR
jgi:hypothetical protein